MGTVVDHSLEVFARAFAQIRSRTYPVVPELQSQIWILADTPYRTKARASELITTVQHPDSVLAIGAQLECPRWVLTLAVPKDQDPEPVARDFKNAGYKRICTEPFYIREPSTPLPPPRHEIQRVQDRDLAAHLRKRSKGKQIEDEHIENPEAPNRLYACLIDGEARGWVSTLRIDDLGVWISNLWVEPSARRQGIGTSLMHALLKDNPELVSVLAASSAGSHLYPRVGFEQIATLLLFRAPNYPRKPRELCL